MHCIKILKNVNLKDLCEVSSLKLTLLMLNENCNACTWESLVASLITFCLFQLNVYSEDFFSLHGN